MLRRSIGSTLPLLLLLFALDSPAAPPLREYVDEMTAVSVTYVATPLVFSREHPSLGVNVREFLSLAPVELNAAGRESYYLFGYLWHTGAVSRESLEALGRELLLLGEDRRIRLKAVGRSLREIGLGAPPWPPPVRGAHPVVFSIDAEALRYLAQSPMLAVELPAADGERLMTLWRDTRGGIGQFLEVTVD